MLWVTISERMVRKTSRPMSTGPADVHERLVADEREIADGERRPRVAMAAAAEPHRAPAPDPRAEERAPAAKLEIGAELRELADRDDLLAEHGRTRAEPHAVLDHDPRRDDERAVAEVDAVADRGRRPRGARRPSRPDESARNASWSSAARNAGSSAPVASSSSNVAGSDTPSVDTPARTELGRRCCRRLLRVRSAASTSFSVMKPRLSISARSMPWSSASSTALRVALRSPAAGFGAGFSSAFGVDRRELVGGLRDVRDGLAELDLDLLAVELDDRARAGRLDLDGRLRRLDDADRLAGRHLGAILDEPLREERVLGVRVLAREDDLEH